MQNFIDKLLQKNTSHPSTTLFVSCGSPDLNAIEAMIFSASSDGSSGGLFIGQRLKNFKSFFDTKKVTCFSFYSLKLILFLFSPFFIIFYPILRLLFQNNLTAIDAHSICLSTLMRKYHLSSVHSIFETNYLKVRYYILRFSAVRNYHFWLIFLKIFKIERIILVDRGYTPLGELFSLGCDLKIDVLTWNLGHIKNSILLKRYDAANIKEHFASTSSEGLKLLFDAEIDWDDAIVETRRQISASYKAGEWWSEVGTTRDCKNFDENFKIFKDKINRIQKNFTTKVLVASHIMHDATFFWGENLFDDYEQWLKDTIIAASEAPNDVLWIIKLHPANIVKNHRDGLSSDSLEEQLITRLNISNRKNIVIIRPNEAISALDLVQWCDAVVTVRGTIGLEAMLYGTTVLTGGTGRYDRKGGTLDFTTMSDYLSAIKSINTYLKQKPNRIDTNVSGKIAVSELLFRPFTLKSLDISYSTDLNNRAFIKYDDTELHLDTDFRAINSFLNNKNQYELTNRIEESNE